MKYVMLKTKIAGIDKLVPIIFPDFMCHINVDTVIKAVLSKIHKMEAETFSAGDIRFESCFCSGESSTLKIHSHEIDSEIINGYDYLHGLMELDNLETGRLDD